MRASLKGLEQILIGWILGLLLLPWGGLWAQEQQATEPPRQPIASSPQANSPENLNQADTMSVAADYVIGPEDLLDVEVFNVPELTKTVRVANDGMISLPLIGRLKAAGYTTAELRQALEAKWAETYLENPQVTVFVREFRARPVSVIGAVDKPGLYYLSGRRTLIEVLSMAGGLAKRVDQVAGRTVLVTRREGFGDLQFADGMKLVALDKLEVNLRKLLYSHEDALNIEIKPFDTISVARAEIVYVVGEVRKPGGFVLQDQEKLTVLQALALAEGLTGTAARRSAIIIHRSEDGSRREVPVNLGKVLKGKSQDLELAANDILFVPTSTGKAAGKRGLEAAVATLSGLLIYRPL
jgi:polysaccharide export outer membrane protein